MKSYLAIVAIFIVSTNGLKLTQETSQNLTKHLDNLMAMFIEIDDFESVNEFLSKKFVFEDCGGKKFNEKQIKDQKELLKKLWRSDQNVLKNVTYTNQQNISYTAQRFYIRDLLEFKITIEKENKRWVYKTVKTLDC